MDASLASSFKLDRPRGALVSYVEPGGPAQKAGVRPGDVVLEVNDKPIDQSTDLSNTIAAIKPGTDTKLTVWRGGQEEHVDVRVAQLEESQTPTANARPASRIGRGCQARLVVRPLSPQKKKQSVGTEGSLVVEDVQGPAARAGLQPGDMILAVNNRSVTFRAGLARRGREAARRGCRRIAGRARRQPDLRARASELMGRHGSDPIS